MFKHFKTAFIYIGSIIGAGFASGRELIIFFYDKGFIGLLLAAFLLGLMCGIFIYAARLKIKNKFFEYVIFIGMCLTYILMVSATESIARDCFSIKYVGVISGILIAILSCFDIGWIKIINAIAIPLVIIMLVFLATKTNATQLHGISVFNAFKYVGMNTLLGGIILGKDEESFSNLDIMITSLIVGVFFAILFYCTYKIACRNPDAEMPVFSFAKNLNLKYVSAAIIYLAIFTTQLSSGYLVCNYSKNMISTRVVGPVFLCLISIFSHDISYKGYSAITYPILGYMGLVYIAYILIMLTIKRVFQFNNFVNCLDSKIHNGSHKTKQNCRSHN